jgi:hypothetical protein
MSNPTFTLQSTLRRVEPLGALSAAWRRLRDLVRRDPPNAARDAEAVRQLATRYRDSDRGFAADLYIAADRHEQIARAQRPGSAADRRR